MIENIIAVILVLIIVLVLPMYGHYLTNMITSGFYDARARYINRFINKGGNDGKEEQDER